jgi:hypothetical protein
VFFVRLSTPARETLLLFRVGFNRNHPDFAATQMKFFEEFMHPCLTPFDARQVFDLALCFLDGRGWMLSKISFQRRAVLVQLTLGSIGIETMSFLDFRRKIGLFYHTQMIAHPPRTLDQKPSYCPWAETSRARDTALIFKIPSKMSKPEDPYGCSMKPGQT